MTPMLKALLREPMVQFLAAGAGLFLLFHWGGPPDGEAGRITVSASQIEHLTVGFTRVRQRPPTESELQGLIDDHVREAGKAGWTPLQAAEKVMAKSWKGFEAKYVANEAPRSGSQNRAACTRPIRPQETRSSRSIVRTKYCFR